MAEISFELKPKGYLILGPKESLYVSATIMLYYEPTEYQKRNIKEMFGWDFVTIEEGEILLKQQRESHE